MQNAHVETQLTLLRLFRPFDNRHPPFQQSIVRRGRRLAAAVRGRPLPLCGDSPHFWFECANQRYVYAYIYKNACTAFKNFIVATSPFLDGPVEQDKKINFLLKHHHVRGILDVRHSDVNIFVYRDPVERIASLYKNKFICRNGHADLFSNIRALTGDTPESYSIADFVQRYVAVYLFSRTKKLRPRVDHHILGQRQCLAPIRYHAAIELGTLPKMATELFGDEIASRFFLQRTNASSAPTYSDDVSRASSEVLRYQFVTTGELPENYALVPDSIKGVIEDLYRADYEIIHEVEKPGGRIESGPFKLLDCNHRSTQ